MPYLSKPGGLNMGRKSVMPISPIPITTMAMDTHMYLAMCFDRNATRSSTVNSTAAPVHGQLQFRFRIFTGVLTGGRG